MKESSDATFFERVRMRGNPLAHPDAVVVHGNARFTVLTSRLIRMEWSATGTFEDRATFAFPTRYAEPPPYTATIEGDLLTIDTGALQVRYERSGIPFDAHNLAISYTLDGVQHTWHPGTPDSANLRGTTRTLDGAAGDVALDPSLLSRAGWALFDDSRSICFNQEDGWVSPRPDHDLQDWYFFGYGHDYKTALAEYTRFGGPIPLIPRFVLGAWWSRYWAYSDQDLKDLVEEFRRRDLPLDVLVIDMDWHTTDSWTGYTWNRELFPDPPGFLRWVHERGLRATLNLHPALGVQSFEEAYPRFAEAMGVDPSSKETVPFRISDKRFVENYFALLHHPLEEQGVDFWWMDWQQGRVSEMQGLDPLPWLNHLHFHDSTRHGLRAMLYSRWGGLGNHRYHIGFSGDTIAVWPALRFLPFFTATASNVCYGWWSHDIGGHFGATEPELYARWVQFGALSPCLRLHSSNDPLAERRPWAFPEPVFDAARAAFHLRYQLVPYLYTMARVASDTSISLCRPMYYEHPQEEAAYAARSQYYLGDQIIAAPIVHPANPATGIATTDAWLPEGTWIDWQTKEQYEGPRWVRLAGGLQRVPMLVRAGAIVPLAPPARTTDAIPNDVAILSIWPGAHGAFRLYEDDGTTEAYHEGQFEWTPISMRMDQPDRMTIEIAPAEGRCDQLPEQRRYEIRLEGTHAPAQVVLDGAEHSDWAYDAEALVTTVHIPARSRGAPVRIEVAGSRALSALGAERNQAVIRADLAQLLGSGAAQAPWEQLIDHALQSDASGRADAVARLGGPFMRFIEFTAPEDVAQRLGRAVVGAPTDGSPFDVEITWRLYTPQGVTTSTTSATGAVEPQIIDCPFTFDGQIQTMRWEAEARLTWRGTTLTTPFRSQTIFPTISTWRVAMFNPETTQLAPEEAVSQDGQLNPALDWREHSLGNEELSSITKPFGVQLTEHLRANEPAAAYGVATIVSPDEREVMVVYQSSGAISFTLNGSALSEAPDEDTALRAKLGFAPFIPLRRSVPVRLRAGANRLLARVERTPDRPWWAFGAAIVTPEGDPITDLTIN